ncbi:AbiV family abortive infection protein [Janthinobacterium sp. GMG2]|uniref:AbiV family abortive infection protein n=1 Tax=Janthinobacterium sp. GMG2 TaxID=3096606 RepID=UPI0029F5A81F|nr:AbiV family abortive infection protein [Janthinobacterium sp. GMG2]
MVVSERPNADIERKLEMTKIKINSPKKLSMYKWKKLGSESLRNALRLHQDSISLFDLKSYPSAFQLSVLTLEEFAKAKWVEHYYYSSVTNEGFPDAEFEQGWLKLLYIHSEKQFGFVARDMFEYSSKLVNALKSGDLERRKQQAVYVGLERDKKTIKTDGKISLPTKIKYEDAKRMISWINAEFLFARKLLNFHGSYFGIEAMDDILLSSAADCLKEWPFKSRMRSRSHLKAHINQQK